MPQKNLKLLGALVGVTAIVFLVEFVWMDGTLFKHGACCGANEAQMPTVWQFPYTVKQMDGVFKVMEGPVIIP